MPSQQELIDVAYQQLTAIADQIRARPNTPTQEGDWTVWELLCHVAATSNYDELFRRVKNHGGTFPRSTRWQRTIVGNSRSGRATYR